MHASPEIPVKDSLLRSSFRKFLNTFLGTIAIGLGFILIFMLISFAGSGGGGTEPYQIDILPDLEGNTKILSPNTPAILQLDIIGVIGMKKLQTEEMRQLLIQSRKGLLGENRVKAILLRINSPGGAADDADGIYRLIMDYKKQFNVPVYAYVDGMCASGGIYIASAADKIYSSPSSVIGSIGVRIGPFMNASDVLTKIGISSLTITAGKGKDALSPVRKWEEGEDKPLRAIVDYLYERFVTIVTTARPKVDATLLREQYGAHVFDPVTAEKIGLVDQGISDYQTALTDLLAAASLEISKPYQVIALKPRATLATYLSDPSVLFGTREIIHKIELGGHDPSLFNKFTYLYVPELDSIETASSY